MLATTLGIPYDEALEWDEKRKIWMMDGQIVSTKNVCASAVGVDGKWTSVVAASILVP